jgi:SET family sugar efflux transporter-like MFS transporter
MNSLFLGGMIGSVSMGVIASATSFQTVLYTAAFSAAAALFVLVATFKMQPKPVEDSV